MGDHAGSRSRSFADALAIMKLFPLLLLIEFAIGTAVPQVERKVDYSGFKVLRLALSGKTADVEAKIEKLAAHVLNPGKTDHLDVVVSPDKADAIAALAVESTVITEDVGAALEEEGELSAFAG